MIETYSREIAVQEGVRKYVEINKGCVKRPVSRLIRNVPSRVPTLQRQINPTGHMTNVHFAIDEKNDKERYKEYKYNYADSYKVNFFDLTELESFKNKAFCVYVEKQHNNIYSLRNLYSDSIDDIVEVEFEKFVDIVGKALFMNVDKKDGKLKVNKVLRIRKE